MTAAYGFAESGHAQPRVAAQLQGVAPRGIHSPDDDVDAVGGAGAGPAGGFHPDEPVADDEVAALHEGETERARQECLVECRFAQRSGSEDHDSRVVALGGHR